MLTDTLPTKRLPRHSATRAINLYKPRRARLALIVPPRPTSPVDSIRPSSPLLPLLCTPPAVLPRFILFALLLVSDGARSVCSWFCLGLEQRRGRRRSHQSQPMLTWQPRNPAAKETVRAGRVFPVRGSGQGAHRRPNQSCRRRSRSRAPSKPCSPPRISNGSPRLRPSLFSHRLHHRHQACRR
jgi:hypothetical protein